MREWEPPRGRTTPKGQRYKVAGQDAHALRIQSPHTSPIVDYTFSSPQNSCVEALILKKMMSEDAAFGRG